MKDKINEYANDFANEAKRLGIKLATAESCTAGLISASVAMVSGSSAWLDCGFTVYTAEAKNKMLGVKFETIEKYNITSKEVAKEMSVGALMQSDANLSIAVTGVAGPNGGTKEIPVGTVAISFANKIDGIVKTEEHLVFFTGSRNEIRKKVVIFALANSVKFFENNM